MLFELHQTGTLKDYIFEFRKLATRSSDVGLILLKSCFRGGLKKEIRHEVKLFRPITVHEATALALQVDHKFTECRNTNSRVALVSKPLVS